MSKYKVKVSSKFKKDLKLAQKRGLKTDKLKQVVNLLADGQTLSEQYRNHSLKGNYTGYMECHIQPDWLLIYKIQNNELLITLARTGTHSDLFNE